MNPKDIERHYERRKRTWSLGIKLLMITTVVVGLGWSLFLYVQVTTLTYKVSKTELERNLLTDTLLSINSSKAYLMLAENDSIADIIKYYEDKCSMLVDSIKQLSSKHKDIDTLILENVGHDTTQYVPVQSCNKVPQAYLDKYIKDVVKVLSMRGYQFSDSQYNSDWGLHEYKSKWRTAPSGNSNLGLVDGVVIRYASSKTSQYALLEIAWERAYYLIEYYEYMEKKDAEYVESLKVDLRNVLDCK